MAKRSFEGLFYSGDVPPEVRASLAIGSKISRSRFIKLRVSAPTKSEARAEMKRQLGIPRKGRLPVGTLVHG